MTLQKRDILQYNEEEIQIWEDILHDYFETFPERLLRTPFLMTTLWRGYFAEFNITKANELYITSLRRYVGFDKENGIFIPEDIIDHAFPHSKKCNFFSAYIRIDNNFFDTEFQEYVVLEFENGNLLKEHRLHKAEFDDLKSMKRVYNKYP
jgi:hypothetical protein